LVGAAGARFTLKRVAGVLKSLVKNRRALIGLFLLAAFVFMALAAPLLSPYGPTQTVAGNLAQPEWVTNFPDGYYLSKNIVSPSSGAFTSPSSIQPWTLSGSPANLTNVQESYSRGVNYLNASAGSLQLSYTGNSPATFRILETFQFPYRGPPARFIANIHYMLGQATNSTPVNVKVFVERSQPQSLPSTQDYFLVNENETVSGQWFPSASSSAVSLLDSQNQKLTTFLGFPLGVNPSQIIFSEATSYSYGIEVTFYGHQTINIDDFRIQLFGTAWGLLGTDYSGSDVFTQTIYGSRISLFVGLLAAGIGIGLGLVVGLLAGFLGKIVDEVLMRFTDMMLVIPSLPLLIVLVAVLGPNIYNIIIIIGFLGWMGFARIIRAQVLTLRERPFIEAARASGAGPGRIIIKHVFPNIVSLTYVNLALSVPAAILTESALAFLGLSDPSVVSWGHMFQNIETSGALSSFPPTWWWVLPPGFGIALVSLSFILIGYALDEIFNPRLRQRR
jgi:ABC-type dipeptide/oligopeptide/nickel transport system permease subunit